MNISAIPDEILTATVTLLKQYCPDISQDSLLQALKAFDGDAVKGPNEAMPKFLTQHQVADHLAVSVWTIMRMRQAGDLPARKIRGQWRIPAEAILALARE
jgi:excisionase family DNA binding protein